MRSLNKVFLMGHLGRAPELLVAKSGQSYTRLSLATRRQWRDDEDHVQEHTDWHSVTVWGNQARSCCDYLNKGSLVFVEGLLRELIACQTGCAPRAP